MRGVFIYSENDNFHTGDDLDLVQEEKVIDAPEIQMHTIEIPGRDGLLDLSDSLTGFINFYNRAIKLKYCAIGTHEERLQTTERILQLHGQTITLIDDDTPEYYYTGRANVSASNGKGYSRYNIDVDAYPYRRKIKSTSRSVTLSSSEKSVTIENQTMPSVPEIVTTGNAQITIKNKTYSYAAGTHTAAWCFTAGKNEIKVKGSGTLTISYHEGVI